MQRDLRPFWHRLQSGVEVAVAGNASDLLLGVRDGFLRYFRDGLDRPIAVAVVPHPENEERSGLPTSDEEMIRTARARAHELERDVGGSYHFYVGSIGGLHSVELAEGTRYFVRSWTVICGIAGEAIGGSGSLEVPTRLIAGLDDRQIPLAVPGTRRRGGMIHSLTGGLESRRTAIAVSTLHALATLLYGVVESRPIRNR